MKYFARIIILLTFGLISCSSAANFNPIVGGKIDISTMDFSHKELILDGEWLMVKDILTLSFQEEESRIISFPSYWKKSPQGCASFKMEVINQRIGSSLAIQTRNLVGSHAVYIDGVYIGGFGKPGESKEKESTDRKRNIIFFTVPGENFDIIIHSSNFNNTLNGQLGNIYLSDAELARHKMYLGNMRDFIIQGLLISTMITYFAMFFMGNRKYEYLFFALTCLGSSLWLLFNSSFTFDVFPLLNDYELIVKMNMAGLLISCLSLILFSSRYRGMPCFNKTINMSLTLLILTIGLVILLPSEKLVHIYYLCFIEIILGSFLALAEVIVKVKKRALHLYGVLPGFITLFTTLFISLLIDSSLVSDLLLRLTIVILVMQQILYHTFLSLISFTRIKKMNSDYQALNLQLKDSLVRIEAQSELITHICNRDTNTGLPNKSQLSAVYEREISRAMRKKRKLHFIMIEMCDYKKILDHQGLTAQTEYICTCSDRIGSYCSGREWICRYSEDRLLIMTSLKANQEEQQITELYEILREKIYLQNEEFFPQINIGVTSLCDDSETVESLLSQLFLSLEYAKKRDLRCPCLFNDEINSLTMDRTGMEKKLRKAIKHELFEIKYQPQHSAWDFDLEGMEALIRWTDPILGPIPPEQFIPLAEEMGLMEEIDFYVIKKVLQQILLWKRTALSELTIAINISPSNFVNPAFVERIIALIENRGINPEKLELELTESILVLNRPQVKKNIERLKSVGFTIALDDFGTGYSSLAYLSDFAVDVLKIDKAFVNELTEDQRKMGIVNSIIGIGHALGIRVISEGVESTEEMTYLKNAGCNSIQGYYFSEPLSSKQMLEYSKKILSA